MSGIERDYTLHYNVDGNAAGELKKIGIELWKMERNSKEAADATERLDNNLKHLTNSSVQAGQSLTVVADGGQRSAASFMGLNVEAAKFIAMQQGFTLMLDTIRDIGERARNVRDAMKELAEGASEVRQEYRELANLHGQSAPTNQELLKGAAFGVKAGMTPVQSARFLEQFEGSLPAGLQKGNISRPVAEQVAQVTARTAQRVGMSAGTSGDLAGVIGQFQKIENVDQGATTINQILEGLNLGRGKIEPLAKSFIQLAGSTVDEGMGPINNLGDLAALYGSMSTHFGPQRAATYTKIGLRELREVGDSDQAKSLAGMGIDPTLDGYEAMEKFWKEMEKKEAAGVPIDTALQGWGFNRSEGREAMTHLYRDRESIRERRKLTQAKTSEQLYRQNDEFFTSTAGRTLTQKAVDEASKLDLGMQQEDLNLARMAATTRLRNKGALNSNELIIADKIQELGGATTTIGIPSALEKRIDQEAMHGLMNEAQSLGIGEWARHQRYQMEEMGAMDKATFFRTVGQEVSKRGGDPTGGYGAITVNLDRKARGENPLLDGQGANIPRMMDPIAWARRNLKAATGSYTPEERATYRSPEDMEKALPGSIDQNPGAFKFSPEFEQKRQMVLGNRYIAANAPKAPGARPTGPGEAVVSEVLDGDTIKVTRDGKEETVRMAGINTPETRHPKRGAEYFGAEASRHTKDILPVGSTVRIEPQDTDKYGRTVGYVKRKGPGGELDVNRHLVEQGYAQSYTPFDHPRKAEFEKLEAEAAAKGVGMYQSGRVPSKDGDGPAVKPGDQASNGNSQEIVRLLAELVRATREQTAKLDSGLNSAPLDDVFGGAVFARRT